MAHIRCGDGRTGFDSKWYYTSPYQKEELDHVDPSKYIKEMLEDLGPSKRGILNKRGLGEPLRSSCPQLASSSHPHPT